MVDNEHRAVFGYRGAVFAGVPGVLLGHGGNHPRYASYVEVPGNFSIISFYTHIRRFYKQSSPRSVSEQMMVIAPMRKIKVPIASAVSMAVK